MEELQNQLTLFYECYRFKQEGCVDRGDRYHYSFLAGKYDLKTSYDIYIHSVVALPHYRKSQIMPDV
jgi:hypothetical protein